MEPITAAALIASSIAQLIQIYNQYQAAQAGQIPPLETALATADTNFAKLGQNAQAEIDKANATQDA